MCINSNIEESLTFKTSKGFKKQVGCETTKLTGINSRLILVEVCFCVSAVFPEQSFDWKPLGDLVIIGVDAKIILK
jgi:hypothetical protein